MNSTLAAIDRALIRCDIILMRLEMQEWMPQDLKQMAREHREATQATIGKR